MRESEKPEIIAMEHEVSVLTAQKSQLDREAATVRAAGIEQKTATNAMLEEIVCISVFCVALVPCCMREHTRRCELRISLHDELCCACCGNACLCALRRLT